MNTFYRKPTRAGALFDIGNQIFMIMFAILMIYPFLNVTAVAFNNGLDTNKGGIYIWPRMPTLANFKYALGNPDLLRGAMVSLLRTFVGTVTGVFCSALLGYIITCRNFMGRKFLRMLFIITMYFGGGLIPTYLLMLRLGFVNTFSVYWVPYLFSAYYMILASSYIQNLPEALFESVRIDGGSEIRILLSFVLPLSMPMLACIAIYSAVSHWNSWFDVNLYSKNGRWDNLQIILYRLLNRAAAIQKLLEQQSADASEEMRTVMPVSVRSAITVIVTMPIIAIYPMLQKYFISGITIGAVKG